MPHRKMMGYAFSAACLVLSVWWAPSTRAATVLTMDQKAETGVITGFDNGALLLKAAEKDTAVKRIPLADITTVSLTWQDRQVRLSTQPAPAEKQEKPPTPPTLWHIDLADGDHLTASISEWTDSHVVLQLDAFPGKALTVPLDHLRAVWSGSMATLRKAKALNVAAATQDVALIEKDKEIKPVSGLATGIDAQYLNFKFEGEAHQVKLDRLAGLLLAQRETTPERTMYASFTLVNDDVVSGRVTGMADGLFHVMPLAGGADAPALDVPLVLLRSMDIHNGRLTWVGDLTPVSVSQVPYFDRLMPYQVNHSLTGGPLTLSDGPITRGIAVHARCVLTYDLDGQYDRFLSKLGFQQPEGKTGAAAIRVLGDDKVLWQDSDLKGDAKPAAIDLSVAGVKTLTLEVDYGKNQDVADRIIWGDARLMKPAAN